MKRMSSTFIICHLFSLSLSASSGKNHLSRDSAPSYDWSIWVRKMGPLFAWFPAPRLCQLDGPWRVLWSKINMREAPVLIKAQLVRQETPSDG